MLTIGLFPCPVIRSRYLHGFGVFVVFATSVFAQETADSSKIRSTVNLVQVTAVAKNRKGNPLEHLTEKDFRITDNGRPQKIARFRYITQPTSFSSSPEGPLTPSVSLALRDSRVIPAILPIFSEDKPLYLFLRVFPKQEHFAAEWQPRALLRNPSGKVVAGPFPITVPSDASVVNGIPLIYQFDLKAEKLKPGHYVAELQLVANGTNETLSYVRHFVMFGSPKTCQLRCPFP